MIIRKISRTLSKNIVADLKGEDGLMSQDDLERRLSLLLIYIALVLTLVPIGLIFNIWQEILLSLIALVYIRTISGGNHFNSPDTCYLVTTFAIIIVPVTYIYIPTYVNEFLYGYAILGYLLLSPHDIIFRSSIFIYKLAVCLGVLVSYLISEVMFLTTVILLVDQVKNNPLWNEKYHEERVL